MKTTWFDVNVQYTLYSVYMILALICETAATLSQTTLKCFKCNKLVKNCDFFTDALHLWPTLRVIPS